MPHAQFQQDMFINASLATVMAALVPQQALTSGQYRYAKTTSLRLGPVALPLTYNVTLRVEANGVIHSEAMLAPGIRTRNFIRCTAEGNGTLIITILTVEAPTFVRAHVAKQIADAQHTDFEALRERLEEIAMQAASEIVVAQPASDQHRELPISSLAPIVQKTPPIVPTRISQNSYSSPTPADSVHFTIPPPSRQPSPITNTPPISPPTSATPMATVVASTFVQPSMLIIEPPGARNKRSVPTTLLVDDLLSPEQPRQGAVPSQAEFDAYQFQIGDVVKSRQLSIQGKIIEISVIHGQVYYTIGSNDVEHTRPESDLEQVRNGLDVLDKLANGEFGYASDFDLFCRAIALQCAARDGQMSCLSNARLDPRPHQIFVAHRVLQDLYPRYLLADEVGLGKTIEAGLILKELKARGLAERVLIVVPASLCEQWRGELATKFNEPFVIHNGAVIRSNLARDPHSNPWLSHANIITSLQFARGQISPAHQSAGRSRQEVSSENRWIDDVEWDLIIFDEAHHLRRHLKNSSLQNGREVSQSYRLAQALEERTRSLLLLTATPLQLSEYDAYSLIELLHPTLFASYESFCDYVSHLSRPHWQSLGEFDQFLRKSATSVSTTKQTLVPLFCNALKAFRTMGSYEDFWRSLLLPGEQPTIGSDPRYTLSAIRHSYTIYFDRNDQQSIVALTVELERQGLYEFLSKHSDHISDWISRQHKLSEIMIRNRKREVLRGELVDRQVHKIRVALTDEEYALYKDVSDYIAESNDCITNKTKALGFILTTFRKLLVSSRQALATSFENRARRLETALQTGKQNETIRAEDADEIAARLDTTEDIDTLLTLTGSTDKADVLADIATLRWLAQRARAISYDSKATKLLEHVGTILQADSRKKIMIFTQFRQTQTYLKQKLEALGYRIVLFHGEQGSAGYNKQAEFKRFKSDPDIQIMIATDVGSEGLNFQFCHILFNYDLPWNPMNIEQRIGRLDRIGQKHAVHIYNFFLDGTLDGRILEVLQDRIRIFEDTIGTLDPILGEEIEDYIRAMTLVSSASEVEQRLRDFVAVAEQRVREARDAEHKLTDFIMDARSFRRDTVDKLLGREQAVTNTDIEMLIGVFLARYSSGRRPANIKQVADQIYKMTIPAAFREQCKQNYKIELRPEYTGTFHPQTAITEETVDFFALGHPLVDAVIRYAIDYQQNRLRIESTVRVLNDNELAGYEGVQFNYLVISDGVRSYRKFVPIVLDASGVYTEARSQRIATLPADEQAAERVHISLTSAVLHNLKRQSREIIKTIAAREFEAAERRNLREFAEVQTKLRRTFDYRLGHQREKLAERQKSLEEARRSGTENRIRLMQGQVDAAHRRIRELEEQRDYELAKLASQHELKPGIQLLNVAIVKVLP